MPDLKLQWEELSMDELNKDSLVLYVVYATHRAAVPGGWLYRTIARTTEGVAVSTVFVEKRQ